MNEKVISEQYRDDIKGYYNNLECKGPIYKDETDGLDKLLSELNSGLEELRNGIPLNQRFEILLKEDGASFRIGKTKGDIIVRITGASFEMKTQKGRGSETKPLNIFDFRICFRLLQKYLLMK